MSEDAEARLSERERELERRESELRARIAALVRRAARAPQPDETVDWDRDELDGLRLALERRSRDLDRLRLELERRGPELDDRADTLTESERLLRRRVEDVTRREVALARDFARLQEEDRRVEAAAEAAAAVPPPVAEPPAQPEPELLRAMPTLWELERRVAERPAADWYVQEERHAMIFFLREYVDVDGVLPDRFAATVEQSFGELL